MIGVIVLLSFVSILLLSYQILSSVMNKDDYMSRLRRYTHVDEVKDGRKKERKKDNSALRDVLTKGIGKMRFLDGYKKRIQTYLTRAHLLLKAEEFITLSLILFSVFSLMILLLKGIEAWSSALLAGAAGWYLPLMVVKSRIRKRIKLLNDQLGDAITMISNSLKAGYSFFQAIDMVSEEMTGPIAEEFGMLKKEVNLGLNTDKALDNLVQRVSSEDLELVITAVLIQRQVGGNLAEVLDNITATIRDRVKIKGELKAITAQGRISGLVISLLPLVLCAAIYMINPGQMSLLFTRPLGLMMVGVAVIMELTGILLIRRIVKVAI